jgi:hypothetical protein
MIIDLGNLIIIFYVQFHHIQNWWVWDSLKKKKELKLPKLPVYSPHFLRPAACFASPPRSFPEFRFVCWRARA